MTSDGCPRGGLREGGRVGRTFAGVHGDRGRIGLEVLARGRAAVARSWGKCADRWGREESPSQSVAEGARTGGVPTVAE